MIILITGLLIALIGVWGMLTRKDLIRIIIGFSLTDTGINLILVAIGYIKGRTAPIIDSAVTAAQGKEAGMQAVSKVIDPIPSALVLTAIVIGLAVTALMLSYAIRMYKTTKSLDIDDYEELKW
jgi:multisubunit Na+/H+ antiporter MnhC subunit